MFWVILIAGIVIYVIYSFFRDRDQMLAHQVDTQGGMKRKYEVLISELTRDANARISNVTRDMVEIEYRGPTTLTTFFITENFNVVQIEWVAQLGLMGTHKHNWSFPHNYPQTKMFREITEYIEWKSQQMFGN